jgi:hypothetical protein
VNHCKLCLRLDFDDNGVLTASCYLPYQSKRDARFAQSVSNKAVSNSEAADIERGVALFGSNWLRERDAQLTGNKADFVDTLHQIQGSQRHSLEASFTPTPCVNGLSLAPAEGAAVDAKLTEVARQQDDRAPGRTLIDENHRSLSEEDSRYEENASQSVSGDIDPTRPQAVRSTWRALPIKMSSRPSQRSAAE